MALAWGAAPACFCRFLCDEGAFGRRELSGTRFASGDSPLNDFRIIGSLRRLVSLFAFACGDLADVSGESASSDWTPLPLWSSHPVLLVKLWEFSFFVLDKLLNLRVSLYAIVYHSISLQVTLCTFSFQSETLPDLAGAIPDTTTCCKVRGHNMWWFEEKLSSYLCKFHFKRAEFWHRTGSTQRRRCRDYSTWCVNPMEALTRSVPLAPE